MIVALKPGVTQESREQLMDWLQNLGLHIHVSEGEYQTILGLVGDTTKVDMDLVASLDIVDSVKRVTEPFKCCNRKFHPEDTVVQVGDVKIGGGSFCVMAGPCSVESEEQIVAVAKAVKATTKSPVHSVKNPRTGSIVAESFGAIILDENIKSPANCELKLWDDLTCFN